MELKNVKITEQDHAIIESLKIHPREPAYEVIHRVLVEYQHMQLALCNDTDDCCEYQDNS